MDKKSFVLRMDEQMFEALSRWASDDFRSVNGQIEWILNKALKEGNRLPKAKTETATDTTKRKNKT